MSIIAGGNVPKDRRTIAENLPNPGPDEHAQAASEPPEAPLPRRLRFDRYVLDLERGCLLDGDGEIALRPKTFDLLRHFAADPGRLVTKDELLGALWPNLVVGEDSIVQCVTELRRALRDQDQRLIRTVHRRGYRFEATVLRDPPHADAAREPPSSAPPVAEPLRALPMASPQGRAPRTPARFAAAALCMAAAALAATWWWIGNGARSIPASPPSIVVLPFQNLGGDPEQEHFIAGLTADLTTDLSRFPEAVVISYATAQTFAGRPLDSRQVGRELDVRYVLEGNVRRVANEVRVNMQLVDAVTGLPVWTERFQRPPDRFAAWQDEVLGRIANTLNLRLGRLAGERVVHASNGNPQAYELASQGWALLYSAKKAETYAQAREIFERAAALDPKAVKAFAGLAWCSAVSALNGWSRAASHDVARAESAVAHILARDPSHVVAHHVRGFLFRLQGRPAAARDAFLTALSFNPNYAPSHAQLGMSELELGRPEGTRMPVEKAIRLSPRDPNIGHWYAMIGMAELHRSRAAEAVVWMFRAVEADTGTPTLLQRAYLVSALALAGRVPEARAALAELLAERPRLSIAGVRKVVRSREAAFLEQRETLYAGLRQAGLPE